MENFYLGYGSAMSASMEIYVVENVYEEGNNVE